MLIPIESSFSGLRRKDLFRLFFMFLNKEKQDLIFFSSSVKGAIVINPTTWTFWTSKHWSISFVFSTEKPFFCASPLVFISKRTSIFFFIFSHSLETFFNNFREWIESIVSKVFTHFFVLFDCKCPINLFFVFLRLY